MPMSPSNPKYLGQIGAQSTAAWRLPDAFEVIAPPSTLMLRREDSWAKTLILMFSF